MKRLKFIPLLILMIIGIVEFIPMGHAGIAYDSTNSTLSGPVSAGSAQITFTVSAGETVVIVSGRLDPNNVGSASIADTLSDSWVQQVFVICVQNGQGGLCDTQGTAGEWLNIWTFKFSSSHVGIVATVTYSDNGGAGQNRQTWLIADVFLGVGAVSNAQSAAIPDKYGGGGIPTNPSNTITLTGVLSNAWVYDAFSAQDGSHVEPASLGAGQTQAQKGNALGTTAQQAATDYDSSPSSTQAMTVNTDASVTGNGDNWVQGVVELDPTIPATNTSTKISCSPTNVATNGKSSTCTITVTGNGPTGTITLTITSGPGSMSPTSCVLSGGVCQSSYSSAIAGTVTINAAYGGDSLNNPSSDSTTVNADTPLDLAAIGFAVVALFVGFGLFLFSKKDKRRYTGRWT